LNLTKTQAWLWASGALLCASGIVHIFIWTFAQGQWEGPVSLRKPILFGLSTGVTLMSLAWIFSKLDPKRYDTFLIPLLSVSLVLEVALITLQYWRGVASHFNRATLFDASIEWSMTALILFASAIIFNLAARSFFKLNAPNDIQIAIQGGMFFLVVSITIGAAISYIGFSLIDQGKSPTTFGSSGVLKFPHGVAIHAIQLFPLMAAGLAWLGIELQKRIKILKLSIASMCVFLLYSLFQTFTGRARYEWNWGGTLLLAISIGFAAAAMIVGLRVLRRSPAKKENLSSLT
jgi:hypothetical protein